MGARMVVRPAFPFERATTQDLEPHCESIEMVRLPGIPRSSSAVMRVLHFYKTYMPDSAGGIERAINAIARGVADAGIESEVLSLSPSPALHSQYVDGHWAPKARLDLTIASVGMSLGGFRVFANRVRRADIVHYHFPWPYSDLAHFVSRVRKPTIVTYHSDIVRQRRLFTLYRPLQQRFLEHVDRIVATSPIYASTSPTLQQFTGKTTIIPLGFDRDGYPPLSADRREFWLKKLPPRFFLFVGVLRYYKGLHMLLRAAEISGMPVVILGDGPLMEPLRVEVARRNLSHVHLLGALDDTDKIALLDLCEAFVFSSSMRSEGFGLALVEAAMMAKPMITCEIGTGTSYINLDGKTGFIVPPENPERFAEAMKAIWDDPARAIAFGRNAESRYWELFTGKAMSAAYIALYRDLLATRRQGR